MRTLRISPVPPPTAAYASTFSRADVFPGLCSDTTASSAGSSFSLLPERDNVPRCEFGGRYPRESPSRAAPPLPCSSTPHSSCSSSLEVEECTDVRGGKEIKMVRRVGDVVGDVKATTELSDLSDEIQMVESRLAAIRLEEAALSSSQRSASHCWGLTRTVIPVSTTTTTTTLLPERARNESHTRPRNYANTWGLSGETTHNLLPAPSLPTRERVREPAPTVVSVVAEASEVVFSLATYLQPMRTVDIEVAPGVYEKLQIFADEEMEDVARRFITKHNLNEQRALKPLYTFLVSLLSKEKGERETEQQTRACGEVSYPVENANITASTCSLGRINIVQSVVTGKSREVSISDVKIPLDKGPDDYSINSKNKQQQQQQQQPIREIAKENIRNFAPTVAAKYAAKRVLNSSGVNGKLSFSCKSNEGLVHSYNHCRHDYQKEPDEPKQELRTTTPVGRTSSPRFIRRSTSSNNNSKAQETRFVDPHTARNIERNKVESSSLLNESRPPDVVVGEVHENKKTLRKCNRDTVKGEQTTSGSARPSRCNSVEGRRTMGSTRYMQSISVVEEPLPTFKPTLAPRSERLVAQDSQRCQTPTYVRLHAQTMRGMSTQTKTATSTRGGGRREEDARSGKPRIPPRSQGKISDDTVGKRLYEQAIEQQRRLEEKRLKEQQKKEEEEWRSILSVPQINNEKSRYAYGVGRDPRNSIDLRNGRTHSRSLLQSHGVKKKVKPHEERELEVCTFAPAVNPASARMFNMVVRGQMTGVAELSSREESRGSASGLNSSGGGRRGSSGKQGGVFSVEERLLLHEEKRRKRLEDERHFRAKFDAATGRPLFHPFLGR